MFELSQETKDAIVAYLKEQSAVSQGATDEELEAVIDGVVAIVKRQFGF